MNLDNLAVPISPEADRHRRYRDRHLHPCPICGAMVTKRGTHCQACTRILNEARCHARRMKDCYKREMARSAALALQKHHEVRAQLMGGSRIDYHNPPAVPLEPDSWDPLAISIPLPDVLKDPPVRCRKGCEMCIHTPECAALVRQGLAVLCERTAVVLAGGVRVEL